LAAVAVQAASIDRTQYLDPLSRYPIYKQLFPHGDGKIVGGQPATDMQFPHQCYMLMDNSYFCGAILARDNKILTAAHCVDGFRSLEITCGDLNRLDTTGNEQKTTHTINLNGNTHIHPGWNTGTLANDVAVVTLSTPFRLTTHVQICELDESDRTPNKYNGEKVTLSGFGKSSDIGGVSNVLNWVEILAAPNSLCAGVYGDAVAGPGVICLDAANGKGSCGGDSGGPLHLSANLKKCIGITSYGASAGCTLGYPVGYSRIAYHQDFISQHIP